MSSSFDWSKYEKETPSEEASTFDWSKYENQKEQPSRTRSLLSALPKGLIKGLQGLNPLAPPGPVSEKLGNRLTEEFLPTQDKTPEILLEKFGNLAPIAALGPEGFGAKALQAGAGAIGGTIAKQNDVGELGQAITEAVSMGIPGLVKGASESVANITKGLRGSAEKLPSGLSKPAAMEAKHASKAIISPERQQKAIANLNQEAANLTKNVVEKELPIVKKIEQGFDFEKQYEKDFGKLRSAAAKANPDIDIQPIHKLLSETTKKYRGIPKLHGDAVKVASEVRAFRQRPQMELSNLLKVYRSNNQKIKSIYETSRLTGKQGEYVDFLVDMNRSIAKSFENTLPSDSLWLKKFKGMNSEYRQFKNGLKTLNTLEGILNQKATPASLEKFATDRKTIDKLALSIGEKGAQEISGIAKDLKSAVKSLKEIPAKEAKVWDTLVPLSIFIPGTHGIGGIVSLKKSADLARRAYGYMLSTSARRRDYENVLKAIAKKDPEAYVKSAKKILDEVAKEESD